MSRSKGKGRRSGGGQFVGLPHVILNSVAWRSLSCPARCLFIELKRRYNGGNNGFINLSCREAAEVFHGSKGTAKRRFEELIQCGFVRMVNRGHYGNRHSSTWLLTTETDDRNGHGASHDWKGYRGSSECDIMPGSLDGEMQTPVHPEVQSVPPSDTHTFDEESA